MDNFSIPKIFWKIEIETKMETKMDILQLGDWRLLMKHNDVEFWVKASKDGDRLVLEPEDGWNQIAAETNVHPEILLEQMDEAVFNFGGL
jgi:hypothetical protein